MNAAGRNSLEIVQFLEAANVLAKNKEGKTALMNAVRGNSKDVVVFLIDKGADIKGVDASGNSLAYYLLESYSKRNEKPFTEKWELLTEKGLDIARVQSEGNTLLHLAVTKNNADLLAKIAAYKIDVNAKNANGLTALHIAAMTSNNVDNIKKLIALGAKTDIGTDFEETVYDLALENELLDKNEIEFLK